MHRSTAIILGAAFFLGFCTQPIASLHAAPPSASKPQTGYHPERLDDPYMPGPGPSAAGPLLLAPAGSVQVNVNASGNNIVGDAANEPTIAIDPTNTNRIIIAWRQFDTIASNFRQAGHAYSTNGGASWTNPGVLDPGVFRSDPVLAADNAGNIFYNSLKQTFCMDVYKSTNGGATWGPPIAALGGDKNWLAVDTTGSSSDGILYAAWQSGTGASCSGTGLFTRSTDHGATWLSPAVAVSGNPRFGVTAVAPDGTVYIAGVQQTNFTTFVVAKSTNAKSAPTPTFTSLSGNLLGGAMAISTGPNPGGLLGQAWVAFNPSNASRVYLLCSVDPSGTDPLDVRFALSTNGGTSFAASTRVNDDSTTNNAYQWFGTMSVAPNGRIDVVWNDTRDDPTNTLSRLYYSASTNEGQSWSANVALTPQWNSTVGWPNQNKIGDYYHMVSDNTGASLAYAATFNGEQDVYFMRINAASCTAPTVNAIANTNATCGVAFTSAAPSTSAGTPPFTWSLFAGAPAGMTMNTNSGVVSWPTPVTTGSPFPLTTIATNACGTSAKSWTLTVNANAPTVNAISKPAVICGASYTGPTPTTSGGVAPFTWALTGSPPSGMTINPSTGVVSWPTAVSSVSPYTISIQASSSGGCGSGSTSWTLTVKRGDFTGDGLVTAADIPGFVTDLLSLSQTCPGDVNGDSNVDGLDVQPFLVALGL